MKRFWPEFPFVFRNYHEQVPTFRQTQTLDDVKHLMDLAQAKRERRRLRNVQNFMRGAFKDGTGKP